MKNMGIYFNANKHKKRTEATRIYYATCSSLEIATTIFIEELLHMLLLYGYKVFGVGGVDRDRGCGWGPVQIACSGVKLNDYSTQLVATVVNERSHQPAVHLAIIQACFSSSSRVLLVSNLRRSNWKCTVKRFFKSTVMIG